MPIQNVSMVARPLDIIRTNPEQQARSAADGVAQACGDLLNTGTNVTPDEYQHSGSNRRERSNGSLLERMAARIGQGTGLLNRGAVAPPVPPAVDEEADAVGDLVPARRLPDGLRGTNVYTMVGE